MKIHLSKSWFFFFITIYTIVATYLMLVKIPWHHDYGAYVNTWDFIINNGFANPEYGNAYGPLFYFFAPIYELNSKLPRVVFMWLFIGAILLLNHKYRNKLVHTLSLILLVSPLFGIFGIKYGSNDVILAAFLLPGLIFYDANKYSISGVALGLATCIKFIPILLIPILFLKIKGIAKYSFLGAFLSTCLVTYFIGYVWLDMHFIGPMEHGISRESKMFSIFRFLRGEYSITGNLDDYSIYILIGGYILLFTWVLRKKVGWKIFIIAIYTWILTSYKVVHHQYYIPYFTFMLYWFVSTNKVSRPITILITLLFVWLNIATLGYVYLDNFWNNYEWIRDWLSLPNFLIQLSIIVLIVTNSQDFIGDKPGE